ncbi:MAG: DUF2147 domain-containing protein [Bacteroidales bacterium]|nr:DUF2147 domain-containing protein [Bacteroidales bacterium]
MKLLISILALLINLSVFSQNADDIIGRYHLPNSIDVELYRVGDKYFGKIIKLNNFENGQILDINNPDKTKRNNLILGMEIIKDLEFDVIEKQWINGSMYGAEKGLVFNLEITKYRENEIEVVGSKYIFWKTLTWIKIE